MVTSICVAERHAFAGDASRKHDIEGAESEAKRGKARALHWLLLLNKLLVQVEGASQESKAEAEPKKATCAGGAG